MKRDEHDILMKIPNVDIEISKEVKCKGYFILLCMDKDDDKPDNNGYIFEWYPDPKIDSKILTEKNIPTCVSASTEIVSEIIKRDLSFTEVSVRFILVDSTRLPRFLFCKHPQLHVQHMLDILIHENIAITRPDRPNAYKIYHQSTKTDADIFGYTPTSSLSASSAVSIAEHNAILKKLNYQPLANEVPPISIEDFNKIIGSDILTTSEEKSSSNQGGYYDMKEVKKQIFLRGLSNEARPYVWPILLGSIPLSTNKKLISNHLEKKLIEYKRIKRRIYLHTNFQVAHSADLRDIKRIIYFDVMRNDRQLEAFSDDNPNLGLLATILTCYSIYNRDSGYCQGMTDLVSPLILIYIKGWTEPEKNYNPNKNTDDKISQDPNDVIVNCDGEEAENLAGKDYSNGSKAIFYDGSIKNYEEAESFIFWNFVDLMNATQHYRLFSLLDVGKQFILERSAAIATSVHKPLKALLDKNELTGLDFLFRPILLLFKREFKLEDLLRVWDSMLSSDAPYCFPRFIAASLLIIIYPKFLLHTNGSLGEVMAVLDGSMEKVEVNSVLQIAASLIDKVQEPFEKHNFIYEALPFSQKLCGYIPKYMKFVDKI